MASVETLGTTCADCICAIRRRMASRADSPGAHRVVADTSVDVVTATDGAVDGSVADADEATGDALVTDIVDDVRSSSGSLSLPTATATLFECRARSFASSASSSFSLSLSPAFVSLQRHVRQPQGYDGS